MNAITTISYGLIVVAGIAVLALIVSLIALWQANEISRRTLKTANEILNEHVITTQRYINRLTDQQGTNVNNMRRQLKVLSQELRVKSKQSEKNLSAVKGELGEVRAFLKSGSRRQP